MVRLEAIPVMGAALKTTIDRFYDNSFDNIGRGNSVSYCSLGGASGVAQAKR